MKIIIINILVIFFFINPLLAEKMTILVYPFKNTGSNQYSWISAGITDTVISDLHKIKDIQVISDRDRIKAIKEIELGQTGLLDPKTIIKAGNLTGANLIFTGSYLVMGERIRIYAKLIRVSTGELEKSIKLDGILRKIFDIQDKVVIALMSETEKIRIADKDPVKLRKEEKRKIINKHRPSLDAYKWYSKGMEIRYANPKKGLYYFEKAIKIDPKYIDALIKAGFTTGAILDKYRKGLTYLKEAEKIMKEKGGIGTSKFAYLMMNIGIIYTAKRELNQAYIYYLKSEKLYIKSGLRNTSDYTTLLINIGIYYWKKGKLDQALKYFENSKRLKEKIGFNNTFEYSNLLLNIGNVYTQRGRFEHAEKYFFWAKKIQEKLGLQNTNGYATLLIDIGIINYYKKKSETALQYYTRARKIKDKLGFQDTSDYALLLKNIAVIYSTRQEFKRSIEHYMRAKKIWDKLGLSNTQKYASLLMNMGNDYREKGNYELAMEYYNLSDNSYKKTGLKHTSSYGHLTFNMAVLHLDLNNKKKAGKFFRKAYTIYVKSKYHGRHRNIALKYARKFGY